MPSFNNHPLPLLPPAGEVRFRARVTESGACWLWTGRTDKRGYGKLEIGAKQVYAHHVAGVRPQSQRNRVLCPHANCINPAHWLSNTVQPGNPIYDDPRPPAPRSRRSTSDEWTPLTDADKARIAWADRQLDKANVYLASRGITDDVSDFIYYNVRDYDVTVEQMAATMGVNIEWVRQRFTAGPHTPPTPPAPRIDATQAALADAEDAQRRADTRAAMGRLQATQVERTLAAVRGAP